jgi:hypothetical protein
MAITIAVHVLLLTVSMRPAASTSVRGAAPPVVHMRLIAPPAAAVDLAVDELTMGSAAERTLSVADLPAPVATRGPIEPLSQPAIEQAVFVPVAEPGLLGFSLPGIADEEDQFVARSLLSSPPVPLAPVVITYPDFDGQASRYIGELTLFIDESGVVVRVKAEGSALPPPLEEAARNAFMQVRFRPGELTDHGVVKSRIRVEVVFEGGAPLRIG